MKRATWLQIATVLMIATFAATGCLNDGNSTDQEIQPSTASTSKVVVKAALIDVLWGLTDEPDPDALCVANSTLTFKQENPLMIMRNAEPSEFNIAPVVIAGSINIPLLDPATDGRASECPSEAIQYIVSASESAPIDIEPAEASDARLNLETKARTTPTAYPTGCLVKAHFEKSGTVPEVVEENTDEEAPEVEEADETPEEVEEEESTTTSDDSTKSSDKILSEDDASDDDASDEEVSEEETADDEASEDETEEDSEEDVPAPVYSLKLVIDEYDCSQQSGYTPPNTVAPRAPATPQQQ